MKNVKEREAKLARLGQTIQERHQQNTKLLKVSYVLAAKQLHMVHNAAELQTVHTAMIQWLVTSLTFRKVHWPWLILDGPGVPSCAGGGASQE